MAQQYPGTKLPARTQTLRRPQALALRAQDSQGDKPDAVVLICTGDDCNDNGAEDILKHARKVRLALR